MCQRRTRKTCPTCIAQREETRQRVQLEAEAIAQRIERMEKFRSVKNVPQSQDQSQLVSILLQTEVTDIVRRVLELSTTPLDEMYGKLLYHSTMLELECLYSAQYEEAKKHGYRKHFATFIQRQQSYRDGRTLDMDKVRVSNFTNSFKGSPNARYVLQTDIEDIDEHTDYTMLFDTARDMRFDEEHEARAERWKYRNGI